MKRFKLIAVLALIALLPMTTEAQMDALIQKCKKEITKPFVSDGQYYTVLLNDGDIAEFYATFYGGTTYRLVGYVGEESGDLAFSVYDQDRNLLFTNRDFENTPTWDFKFENTMDCIIEAEIDSKNITSGIAVLLIGFKQ